jgi:hypothetical protein
MYFGIGLITTTILKYAQFAVIPSPLLFISVFRVFLTRENTARENGLRDEIIGDDEGKGLEKNGRFASVAEAKREKGDAWSGYRYRT